MHKFDMGYESHRIQWSIGIHDWSAVYRRGV